MMTPKIDLKANTESSYYPKITVNGKKALKVNLHQMKNKILKYFIKYRYQNYKNETKIIKTSMFPLKFDHL